MPIGLYIHIPFCASKCYYCDFLSFKRHEKQEAYVDALIQEMEQTKKDLVSGTTIKSIFIGGGTPTVLPPLLLDKLLKAVVSCFNIEPDAEWTIESNPVTIDIEKLQVLRKYPITRISLGLQSTHDDLLRKIGRIHTFKDWEESIRLIKQHTSWEINTDLMFALPGQTEEAFLETLNTVTAYDIDLLSVYALIIEEGTTFYKLYEEGKLEVASDELDRRMYHTAQRYLNDKGYIQYEISNWSKLGKSCKHNAIYWQLEPYIGIGLGAHSLMNHARYYNETNMEAYLSAAGNLSLLRKEEEQLTKEMAMQEYMFLGLRLLQGIDTLAFERRFGESVWQVYNEQLTKWIKYNVLVKDKERIYLSPYGLDVCNEVFASFL